MNADHAQRLSEIKRMRDRGQPLSAIGATYGISRQRVSQILLSAGKPTRQPKPDIWTARIPPRSELTLSGRELHSWMQALEISPATLARMLGKARYTIERWLDDKVPVPRDAALVLYLLDKVYSHNVKNGP